MKQGLVFLALCILLISLACQTLVGGLEPTQVANLNGTKPTRVPSPTPTPTPIVNTRLNGDDLPDLEFDPPIASPIERGRPSLSGSTFSLDTQHFRVHYTLRGDDKVPEEDENANREPDYVEEVAKALEYVWYAEIDYFGWPQPPSDGELGGNGNYDVYLSNIMPDDYAGFTDLDRGRSNIGDNPLTTNIKELNSTHSYLVLDNDYREYNDFKIPGISLLDYMHSAVAHEFNHAIQFGIDGNEPDTWLWEATSTWMEDEVFDDVNETIQALMSEFKSPDTCQLAEGGDVGEADAGHWYGEWVFIRYLSERYGENAVRRLWELAADKDGYAIWDALLAEHGTTLKDFYKDFSVALLTRGFEEGDSYPTVRLEGHTSGSGDFVPTTGVYQMAADFIEIVDPEVYTVNLNADDLVGMLVGIREGQSYLFPMLDNNATIDTTQFEHTYIIVLNLNRATNESNCRSSDYVVSLTQGGDPEQATSSTSAPHFKLPKVQDITNPDNLPEDLPGG